MTVSTALPRLGEQLLAPPEKFSRAHPKRSLFYMYSRKLDRQIRCEGQSNFALAIWLEVDGGVTRYNETPPVLDVNVMGGKSKPTRPAAVSVRERSAPTIHVITDGEAALDWEQWCNSHNCKLKCWTLDDLQIGSLLQANRERLLRFSAHAGLVPNLGLQNEVIAELKSVKRMTVHALMRRILGHDEQEVLGAIAAVILQNLVTADIEEEAFDLRTELRVPHVKHS
jgi:hypothetical protein